jgi:hypothetical protein
MLNKRFERFKGLKRFERFKGFKRFERFKGFKGLCLFTPNLSHP